MIVKLLFGLLLSLNVVAFISEANALDDFDLAYYGDTAQVEIKRTDFIVKLVIYKTPEELLAKYKELTGEEKDVVAFAQIHENNPTCYIHLVPATIWDDREDMAVLGHEVYHCALAIHEGIDK